MTVLTPGPDGWRPRRGDYGLEYLADVVGLIELMNCTKGCRLGEPGSDEPGGSCRIILRLLDERPAPEIDPRPGGPVCTARQPLDGAS
jgi:hypothetical protein